MEKLLRQGRFNSALLAVMFLFQAVGSFGQGSALFGAIGILACGACAMDAFKFHEALNTGEKNG